MWRRLSTPSFNAGSRAGRKFIFGALSAFFGIAFALLLVELALRLFIPAPPGYRAMVPNLEATFNAQLYARGVLGPALFKVNSMGFRSREWTADRASEFRIVCLGGSTTESILNDQSRIWTTVLEQRLGQLPDERRIWVGNMGKAGLASKHHIAQLNHIRSYDPDLIIVLVGSSDFMSRLKQGDIDSSASLAYLPERERTLEEQSFAVLPGGFSRVWKLLSPIESAIFERSESQSLDGSSLKRWRAMREEGKRSNVPPPLEASLAAYSQNLKEMINVAHHAGVPIVLLTQPSIWRPDLTDEEKQQLWMGGVGEFREVPGSVYYEPAVLKQGMDAFNGRLLQVCLDTHTPCIDLANDVPKSTDYFYDDEHFTDRGQELVADRVAEGILQLLPGYQP